MKRLVLYNKHRNLLPIVEYNTNEYYFINLITCWKLTYPLQLFINYKYRKIAFLWMLRYLNPLYILDVHWISDISKICWYYDRKFGKKKKFIVVQHGVYTGGKIKRSFNENFPYTNNFWVWSKFYQDNFFNIFKEKNLNINIKIFGNPVYNHINRELFAYQNIKEINRVLIAPTALNMEYAKCLKELISKLNELQIEVNLKFHNFQNLSYFEEFKHLFVIDNAFDLIQSSDYEAIICDVSTLLLDTICFKKNVIYFQPILGIESFETTTVYDKYLENLFYYFRNDNFGQGVLKKLINQEKQEDLFEFLAGSGNNIL